MTDQIMANLLRTVVVLSKLADTVDPEISSAFTRTSHALVQNKIYLRHALLTAAGAISSAEYKSTQRKDAARNLLALIKKAVKGGALTENPLAYVILEILPRIADEGISRSFDRKVAATWSKCFKQVASRDPKLALAASQEPLDAGYVHTALGRSARQRIGRLRASQRRLASAK